MRIEQLREIAAQALAPGRFWVRPPRVLRLAHEPAENLHWEVFRGHLLDHTQTREVRQFEAWDLFADADHWFVSAKLDRSASRLFVLRAVEVYGWEAASAGNVIESRETRKWQRELVGTLHLDRVADEAVAGQLEHLIRLALVGTSRLPITSLETPLPAYALGEIAYDEQGDAPVSRFDFALRAAAPEQIAGLADRLLEVGEGAAGFPRGAELAAFAQAKACGHGSLFRGLFHQLALSPYTCLGQNLIQLLRNMANRGPGARAVVVDSASYMVRHLVRHLTAFDLVNFHHFGANYPDALLLDGLLKFLLEFISPHADRLARRAVRQGWIARKMCEGLAVPDHPTSSGENLRVMPPEFPRLAEAVITQPARRSKRLFTGEPAEALTGADGPALRGSLPDDLRDPAELRELGTATFLDRPLGTCKAKGEVDRTPLVSYEAFSREIAQRRLQLLREWGWLDAVKLEELKHLLSKREVSGVAAIDLPDRERPGVVALEDSLRAARDFVIIRTTRSSLDRLLAGYDWAGLVAASPDNWNWLRQGSDVLFVRSPRMRLGAKPTPYLSAFDGTMQLRLELGLRTAAGCPAEYLEWVGTEYLAGGLELLRTWERDTGGEWREREFAPGVRIFPRLPGMTCEKSAKKNPATYCGVVGVMRESAES